MRDMQKNLQFQHRAGGFLFLRIFVVFYFLILAMNDHELEALVREAEEANMRGVDFAKAEKLARKVLHHLPNDNTSRSRSLHIRTLIALTQSLCLRGLAKEAFPIAKEALDLSADAKRKDLQELQAKAFRNIGNVHHKLSEFSISRKHYEKALRLDKKIGNKAGMVADISNIGRLCEELTDYEKALEYDEMALSLARELNCQTKIAPIAGNIGNVYRKISKYAKALEYYDMALALDEELGNKAGVATHISNIGILYAELSQWSKAIEYIGRALTLSEEIGDMEGVARQSGNLGAAYHYRSEYATALKHYEKALALDEELGNIAGMARHTGNIGDTLSKMGRNVEAMNYLQRALDIMRNEIEATADIASTLISIGSLYVRENRLHEAEEKLKEGLAVAEQLGEKHEASEAHKELSIVYATQADKVKAFDHLQAHNKLKEEIFSDDTRKQIEAFNIRIAVAEKEKQKQLAEVRAQQLESELSTSTLQFVAQTELLAELRNDLLHVIRKFPLPDGAAKELRDRLKTLPCKSVDWERFDTQFKAAHPEFAKRLMEAHPTLSHMELRVCTLLRMNLRSAEIARLFCLSERTVEDHRANIRKKMKLKRSEDLIVYLTKL